MTETEGTEQESNEEKKPFHLLSPLKARKLSSLMAGSREAMK